MADRRQRGFTLIELMAVIVIVCLLLVLTLPAYQRHVQASRRSIARAVLQEAMARQEQYFVEYKQYAGTLAELGYSASPFAISDQGDVVDNTDAHKIYLIHLTTRTGGYTLHASPQLSQAGDHLCAALSLSSTGVKKAAGVGATAMCW